MSRASAGAAVTVRHPPRHVAGGWPFGNEKVPMFPRDPGQYLAADGILRRVGKCPDYDLSAGPYR